MGRAGLTELGDASHSYDWGLFLPLGKSSGFSMNCICANKPFAVLVKQSHLPMVVFSPSIFRE